MKTLLICLALGGCLLASGPAQAQTTAQAIYLSGLDKDHTVEWDFFCTKGRKAGQWGKIAVPSCWELQGYGTYNYGNDKWATHADEEGLYRHRFTVPSGWKGRHVNLVFEGSMTDTEVKVNGKLAGPVHQGAFYRFKHNIGPLLKYGAENLLEVKVSKKSANESVNRAERYADYWIFGGIFRPVYLESLPSQHLGWLAIDARADGALSVLAYPGPLVAPAAGWAAEAQVQALDGTPVGPLLRQTALAPTPAGELGFALQGQIGAIKPWSPEFPHRYQVRVQLKNRQGQVVHELVEKFGFRTVQLRPQDGFYVNGAKIRFKGVNRHSFWPSSGRTTSRQLSEQDVLLMKEMNLNAVRMSHYPPDKYFLEVCDSLGLLVLNELGGWQKPYDTLVGRRLVRELVVRDVNHPCVVAWDNGNEGGNNHALADDYAKYDPQQRPVIHPWAIFRHTDTNHYKPWNCCAGMLAHGREVFFPTEMLHGLYDGGGAAGLDDFWQLVLNHPLAAGGFIWCFADEAVVRTDRADSLDSKGNQAPDGIVGPYREKEGSFYTIQDIWSPIQLGMPAHLFATTFGGSLPVENHYHFTSLDQCQFEWQLVDFPLPSEGGGERVRHRGQWAVPAVAPGERAQVPLPLPAKWARHGALRILARDPHGREVRTWSFPIQTAYQVATEAVFGIDTLGRRLTVDQGGGEARFSNGKLEVRIDKTTGLLAGFKTAKGELPLRQGPSLAGGGGKVAKIEAREWKQGTNTRPGNAYIVEVTTTPEPGKPFFRKLRYLILANGWVKIEYEYLPSGQFDLLGMHLDLPESLYKSARFLGNGPYRVWRNRLRGPTFGLHQKAANQTVTGEGFPLQYPEFAGYHANFYWAQLDLGAHRLTLMTEHDDLYLRLGTPPRPRGAQNDHTSPPFPPGSLGLMHGIPAIGDKFLRPEATGPQGQKNQFFTFGADAKPLAGSLYILVE